MDASFQSRAEQLANEFASQATTVEELNGLIRLMMKSGLERMLNTEMDVHLGRRSALATDEPPGEPPAPPADTKNRRNGHSPKTVKGDLGEVAIATVRSSRKLSKNTSGACPVSMKRFSRCTPRG